MNFQMIRYILCNVLAAEGTFMLIPAIAGFCCGESQAWIYLVGAIVIGAVGLLGRLAKPKDNVFYLKDGCVATASAWILMGLIGALPMFVTGDIPNYLDALFESISGLTTTGASIVADVEKLSHATLMWRSTTHWIGGMGVLVFILAIVPLSGGSNINLMRAESPGPSVSKLVPKMKQTARILYLIYIALAVLMLTLLLLGGMSFFDAVNTALSTAGTGGFGLYNDSCASFSPYLQWVITIFMILFGINFNFYYFIVLKQFKRSFKMTEVRIFLIIVLLAVVLVYFQNRATIGVRDSAFTVASLVSSTGFATVDFDRWTNLSRTALVLLMFMGACAGSTGGGIKVSRFILLFKLFARELRFFVHPKSVESLKLDGEAIDTTTLRSTCVYIVAFAVIFMMSVLLLAIDGYDTTTNFTAVTATMNNIGPGLSLVGPTCNYSFFGPLSKVVLMFDMLAGRLELFPMLLLFSPTLWADSFH